jgi:GAF domain-containing protein
VDLENDLMVSPARILSGEPATRSASDQARATPGPRTPAQLAAARAFGELLLDVGDDTQPETFFVACARWLIGESGLDRCGVYVREAATGRFRGRLGVPAAIDETVRRLVIGGRSDTVTTEVVRTRRPVYVPNVRDDARMALAAPRAWNTAALLGVPVLDHDRLVAIFMLDGERRPADPDDALFERVLAFGALAGRWLTRTRRAAQLPNALRELEQERRAAAAIARADPRLSALGRTTFSESVVLRVLADVLGRDALRFGPARTVERHVRPRDAGNAIEGPIDAAAVAAIHAGAEALQAGGVRVVERSLELGVRHRWIVAPVVADGEHRGVVAVVESGTPFSRLDVAMVRRVADLLGLGLERLAAARSRTSDLRHLRAADRLDVVPRTDGPPAGAGGADTGELVVHLAFPAGRSPGPEAVRELERELGGLRGCEGVVALKLDDGVALVVPAPGDGDPGPLRDGLRSVAGRLGLGDAAGGIARAAPDEDHLAGALAEARAFGAWGASRRDTPDIVVADDLGSARLLVTPPERSGAMAVEVLGPLLGDDPGLADLLDTIRAFYGAGRNVRVTGQRLDVHENTIRYRFNRIRELTGRDIVGDPDDQLIVQAALTALPGPGGD